MGTGCFSGRGTAGVLSDKGPHPTHLSKCPRAPGLGQDMACAGAAARGQDASPP